MSSTVGKVSRRETPDAPVAWSRARSRITRWLAAGIVTLPLLASGMIGLPWPGQRDTVKAWHGASGHNPRVLRHDSRNPPRAIASRSTAGTATSSIMTGELAIEDFVVVEIAALGSDALAANSDFHTGRNGWGNYGE